ncbi:MULTISPECIES: hypothetical protein [Streptomycetaceae]|uniref:hypothetical protein n=1 Tax=Streptomycetaceae TaxID=2062 RepID=UPI000939D59E|nr:MULTISPECIES: hypothetical protein [Streptomycetaceae]OKI08534.1 hypothetical protein AMK13_08480 [Streptomyces sp. CB02056]
MPSLRQPVGPLPASIYWRRRVIVLVAVAAVVALIAWLMIDQGGGGDGGSPGNAAQAVPSQSQNQTPAQAITPGASPSGPAARPGGGSGGGPVAGGGGTEVNLSGGTGAGGANPAPGGGAAPATGGGTGGGTGGSGGTGGGAPPVNTPEVMALPVCASSQVALELAGTQNSYQPKDKPRLALTVKNSSGTNCRVDLGRTASVITVSGSNNDRVWSSGDCPTDKGSIWVQLGANGNQTETFTWDRSRSKPQCATADQTPPPSGTYVVLAELTGLSGDKVSARASIRLDG